MASRLKVFVTSDGLTDYVVAVSSKAKALAAWGVHQDVFKEGAAHQTDDPVLVKAATARPGEVLRRPAGTRDKLAYLVHGLRSRPHFVAYHVKDLPAPVPLLARYGLRRPLLTWTVRTPEDRQRAARWADQMIFEGFRP